LAATDEEALEVEVEVEAEAGSSFDSVFVVSAGKVGAGKM